MAEDYRLTFDWSRDVLPHGLLWLHDRGIEDEPWRGRFRGVGFEPIAAAFDLVERAALAAHAGFPTSVPVTPDRPLSLSLTLAVEAGGW